jgi:hypothetical protein
LEINTTRPLNSKDCGSSSSFISRAGN